MAKYANQSTIQIVKKEKYEEAFHYSSNAAEDQAMKVLSHSGLKLFLYFNQNKHSYQFDMSFADAHNHTGISESSYYRGIEELKDKGYLIRGSLGKNTWIFCEVPLPDEDDSPKLG